MQQLNAYVLSLTAAALACGILLSLFSEGLVQSVLRLCCGVFLTVTVLSPLPGIHLPENLDLAREHLKEGEALAAQGEDFGREIRQQRITQTLNAYIQDKAAALGAAVEAQVLLDADGAPKGVILRGSWGEAVKGQLGAQITADLGIPEEDQQWMQEN